jgi:hypothetical protein
MESTLIQTKNLRDLKNYLKAAACAIKSWKTQLKEMYEFTSAEKIKDYWTAFYSVHKMRREFRHHLIAYCEHRGLARVRVERPAQTNLPDEDRILAIKNEFAPTWGWNDNVYPGQK